MTIEPKESREVKCMTYMAQQVHVTPHMVVGDNELAYVSIEGGRVSLDLSKAEAIDLATAIVWAANGGSTGRHRET